MVMVDDDDDDDDIMANRDMIDTIAIMMMNHDC